MESLAAQIRQKNEKRAELQQQSTDALRRWTVDLDELFKQVRWWLEPLRSQGLVKVSETNTELRENSPAEMTLVYQVPVLNLEISGVKVRLEPKGLYVLGSQGVVEVQGIPGLEKAVIRRHFDQVVSWNLFVSKPYSPTNRNGKPFDQAAFVELLEAAI